MHKGYQHHIAHCISIDELCEQTKRPGFVERLTKLVGRPPEHQAPRESPRVLRTTKSGAFSQ